MKRLALNDAGLTPTFIGSWAMEPLSLCDELITYFEENVSLQRLGSTSAGIDSSIKDRIDLTMSPSDLSQPQNEVFTRYFDNLFSCYREYLREWPFLRRVSQTLEIGRFNLGRYHKGQHFQNIHTERTSLNTLHRVLAWMTYLNDVEEGGETYFSHYDIGVKPKKGLTLIWPAEWTHAHKGNVLLEGSKYMITGWLHFPD